MRNVLMPIAFSTCLLGVTTDLPNNNARATDNVSQDSTRDRSSDVVSQSLSGDLIRDKDLYQASCIVCHGPQASGGVGPRLVNNPILSNDQAFWKVVYEGRHVMPPLKGAITEQQMTDIRAWLQTLR